MTKQDLALSLNSSTLNDFKLDFDAILRQTITKMLENNEDEGTVTAKLTVRLYDAIADDGRPCKHPAILHDVKSVVQARSSARGGFAGDYVLEWDQDDGVYILRPGDSSQTSLFDQ